MPLGQLCVLCPSPAEFRCQECGPFIFYCKDCFCSRHKNVNFFHVAEKWEGDGKIVYAIDGLFGLPRKKAAGVSHRRALQGDLFFCDQASVDEFVKKSSNTKTVPKECNDFLAGNALRSSTRFRALDETALYGASCRHEFPTVFCNLKHGERLSYAVYLIDTLVERHNNADIFVMYDVACTLQKYLKHCGRDDLLEKVRLCLPNFHSYGHKATCQISLGPLRCAGVGLSDGEVMERLWSYLRRFSRMTKQMRPAHRVDVLVHALVYYGMRKKDKLFGDETAQST